MLEMGQHGTNAGSPHILHQTLTELHHVRGEGRLSLRTEGSGGTGRRNSGVYPCRPQCAVIEQRPNVTHSP